MMVRQELEKDRGLNECGDDARSKVRENERRLTVLAENLSTVKLLM